ncbi:acyltransferase [Sphingomonas sp. HITSZ_GF]|uniref:acyltransferase family protein n=1 Tax=Sphingomonas sp. HITSZ_GF TaxID=3037247 RepID=UPI00240D5E09|nr:acyltransferase [Sphingomonas sp. HITSZ_GF]MDG2533179.1 acyltransferase [Sphingomonas sp. HITSZ_GF]
MAAPGKRTLETIDLLRLLSALAVLAYHYGSAFGRLPDPHLAGWARTPLPDGWLALSWCGWIGVELFFVISGCVIAGSARGTSAGVFVGRRAARLFPAAWICASLSLAALLLAGAQGPLLAEWLGAMALSPVGPWIDGVYWTLGVEIAFYALVAALLAWRRVESLEPLGFALAGVSLAYWLVVASGSLPAAWVWPRLADLLLLTHGGFFALGIFIRAALDKGMTRRRLLAVALCLVPVGIEIIAHAVRSARELGIAATPLAPMAIFALGVAAMLAANRLQPLLARRLRPGWAMAAGLATYPLYLLHQAAGTAVIAGLVRAGMPAPFAALLTGAAMLALALLIAATAEPWLRARLVRAGSALLRFRPAPIFVREHAER